MAIVRGCNLKIDSNFHEELGIIGYDIGNVLSNIHHHVL